MKRTMLIMAMVAALCGMVMTSSPALAKKGMVNFVDISGIQRPGVKIFKIPSVDGVTGWQMIPINITVKRIGMTEATFLVEFEQPINSATEKSFVAIFEGDGRRGEGKKSLSGNQKVVTIEFILGGVESAEVILGPWGNTKKFKIALPEIEICPSAGQELGRDLLK